MNTKKLLFFSVLLVQGCFWGTAESQSAGGVTAHEVVGPVVALMGGAVEPIVRGFSTTYSLLGEVAKEAVDHGMAIHNLMQRATPAERIGFMLGAGYMYYYMLTSFHDAMQAGRTGRAALLSPFALAAGSGAIGTITGLLSDKPAKR